MKNLSTADLAPLLKLAIPLILSGIAQSAVYFFETMFFAHLGEKNLAAGALVSWLSGTLSVILFGTLSSINVLVAHKYGAKDRHSIALILRDGLYLAFIFGIPLFLLYWYSESIFKLLGQETTIVALATPYLHALAWSSLPNLMMIVFMEFLMGLGATRIILVFDLLFVVVTITTSYLLIFGKLGLPALGIAGAGWGMVISFALTILVQVLYFLWHKDYRNYFAFIFKFVKPSFLRELLHVGVPMGAMFCVEVGFFFVLTLFMGNLGAQFLAANQIVMQYLGIFISVIFAIAQAITVRMGHLLGEANTHAAKKAAYVGFLLSGSFMFVISILYWVTPRLFISVDFNLQDPANANVYSITKQLLAISAVFQIVESLRLSLFGALRGLKDTQFTLIISIISFWCVSLPLGYFFAKYLNMKGQGFWWAMVVGASCSLILLYWRFNLKIKQYYSQ